MGKLAYDREGFRVWRYEGGFPNDLSAFDKVTIRLKNGAVYSGRADYYRWTYSGGDTDIVGYKLYE